MTNNAKRGKHIDCKINDNIQLADCMQLVIYPRLVIDLRWILIRVTEGNVRCVVDCCPLVYGRNPTPNVTGCHIFRLRNWLKLGVTKTKISNSL